MPRSRSGHSTLCSCSWNRTSSPSARIHSASSRGARAGAAADRVTQAAADSSRAFNDWLADDFVRGRGNLFAFPLFDRLADADNWLREEYELVANPDDSHPNILGCTIVGRELMTFLHETALRRPRPPEPTRQPQVAPGE